MGINSGLSMMYWFGFMGGALTILPLGFLLGVLAVHFGYVQII